MNRQLLSGDEAVAHAAVAAGVALGTGYPGTPSTEILETFDEIGGRAQWAPNEKVALEVGLGAAFAGARVLVTMKHVGLNVAADPLFTAAYTGVGGALIVVTADDPGMSSSQNEQDNRRYAVAAGLPMVEPSDSQEAYDFFLGGGRNIRAVVAARPLPDDHPSLPREVRGCRRSGGRDRGRWGSGSCASPSFRARHQCPGHDPGQCPPGAPPAAGEARRDRRMGRGVRPQPSGTGEWLRRPGHRCRRRLYLHAAEAEPEADILKIGLVNPLPIEKARAFAAAHQRTFVIEEGDPVVADSLRAAGIPVEAKSEMYRFGEMDVARVRRILSGDVTPEAAPARGKPPELCPACPYHTVYATLQRHDCIVAGDIGCYSLGVLPPYRAMDTCVAMGASIGVGLGLRHVLPDEEARRVVSIIGDSTFVHSGIGGLVEMAYNPPATGHVVIVLDNGTTAMTGQQEHPGTGRRLDHEPTNKLSIEGLATAIGIPSVTVIDAYAEPEEFERLLLERLAAPELSVIVARRPCVLAAADIRRWEQQAASFRAVAPEQAAADLPLGER